MITFKSDRDIEKMRRAGRLVADILKLMRDMVRPGIDTLTMDAAAEELVVKSGAKPAFKGYKVPWVSIPFPGTICASINEEVVHGIPLKDRVLNEGDIISIDTGASLDGFFGDAARAGAVPQKTRRQARPGRVSGGTYRARAGVARRRKGCVGCRHARAIPRSRFAGTGVLREMGRIRVYGCRADMGVSATLGEKEQCFSFVKGYGVLFFIKKRTKRNFHRCSKHAFAVMPDGM